MKKPFLIFALFAIILFSPLVFARSIDISIDKYQDRGLDVFTIKGSSFDFAVEDDKICTLWSIQSREVQKGLCYGESGCCSLSGFASAAEYWDQDFSLDDPVFRSKDSVLSAQIIYVDYSLDPGSAYAEIIYSNKKSIPLEMKAYSTHTLVEPAKDLALTIYHGTGDRLSIESLNPKDNAFFAEADSIGFDYFVYHKSATITCSLIIDGETIARIENSSSTDFISIDVDLGQGPHVYSLECEDVSGNTAQSSQKTLVADYTPPEIDLLLDDGYLTFMDHISLNFTASDNLASKFSCDMIINDIEYQSINVDSGQANSLTINSLENGTYRWYVSCADKAGNNRSSDTRTFSIDRNQNFSLILNDENFKIGQKGYYIVTAPYRSRTTVMVTDPKDNTFLRHYDKGIYPLIDELNFTDYPGTYTIEAILTYNGGLKRISKNFQVDNTFATSIFLDKNPITKGSTISFEAESSGGLGSVGYRWNFDDNAETTGKTVSHKFDTVGEYDILLTAEDSKGNMAQDTVRVYVKNNYALSIIVQDSSGSPLQGSQVFVDGEKKTADAQGKVVFDVLEGSVRVVILKQGYKTITEEFSVSEALERTYQMPKINSSMGYNVSLALDQQQVVEKEDNKEPQEITDSTEPSGDKEIDQLVEKINDALYSLDNANKLTLDAAKDLNLQSNLQNAKKILLRSKSDRYGLRFIKDEDERERRKQEIEDNIKNIKENLIVGLEVMSAEEYTLYPKADNIEALLERYFTLQGSDNKDNLIRANKELQKSFIFTRYVKEAKIIFISGTKEEITLVKGDFNLEDRKRIMILESIPKDIAASVDDIVFLTPNQVIESDPVVMYDAETVESIVYYIKSSVELEKTKDITAVMIDPMAKPVKKDGFGLTGFAIFSSLSNIDNPTLVIQIALIVILLLVYIIYEFEILVKIRRIDVLDKVNPMHLFKELTNKDLKKISTLIKKAEKEISAEELDKAEDTYHDLIKIYNDSLDSDHRKKVIDKISAVYNDLLVHRILKKVKAIESDIKENKKDQARKDYNKMQELYIQLPRSWKYRVSSECKKAFDLLSK